MLDIPHTVADGENPPIYDALVALKPPELSLGAWATKAGLARNIFNYIKTHGNPKTETLEKLLGSIGVNYADFDAALGKVRTEVAGAGPVAMRELRSSYVGPSALPPLPLLGTAMGGHYDDLDDTIEMVELHLGEVLDYLARPASMAQDRDAYALTILSDSMAPRFEPGERVAVSPREPASIGDDVIVQLRGSGEEEDRIKLVLIKRLVRRTASYVELRQFNPDVTFRIEARRVALMHKVLGRLL